MLDPITQRIMKGVHSKVQTEFQKADTDLYKMACPRCRKVLVKEAFLDYGCFACGYREVKLDELPPK